jgi:hypothetical protein
MHQRILALVESANRTGISQLCSSHEVLDYHCGDGKWQSDPDAAPYLCKEHPERKKGEKSLVPYVFVRVVRESRATRGRERLEFMLLLCGVS